MCSQKWTATADVLYNVQAHEAEKRRLKELNQTSFDLRQTRGGDFPALPPAGDAVAPRPPVLRARPRDPPAACAQALARSSATRG